MNTKDALALCMGLLGEFRVHDEFLEELYSLLKNELKGKEKPFFKLLMTQLKNITEFGVMVHTVDRNEKIRGKNGHYYSIHFKQSQFNVRFLVYIFDDGKAYFLSAFYERGGKKATDYTSHTSILERRLKDLKEEDQNE